MIKQPFFKNISELNAFFFQSRKKVINIQWLETAQEYHYVVFYYGEPA